MNEAGFAIDGAQADALQDLGDEIATLAAHVHAATRRLLGLIVEFDRRLGWEIDGHRSCAHWLAFRTGMDPGTAREHVRVARALERLPQTSVAMSRGELSFAKVRSLTRVACVENESELLAYATANTAAQLERLVRGYRRGNRMDETERERIRHQSRCLSVFPDDDGMYVVRGRLDAEVGALLMRALEGAGDALFRPDTAQEIEPAQRRADAIALLAERALAAGFDHESGMSDTAEADDSVATPGVPVSGTRAQRYQVVIHVEPKTLEWGKAAGRSELEDGTQLSAETSRRVTCDATVVRVQRGPASEVLDVGRRTRTVPGALRRALEVRDTGCRFPGCGLRFCDAHHVVHWADGGATALSNTVLLCRHHHRLVHEGGFRVELPPGCGPNFYDPRGQPVPERPPVLQVGEDAAEALVRQNVRRGVVPDYRTSMARYRREADVPWQIVVRATAALNSGG